MVFTSLFKSVFELKWSSQMVLSFFLTTLGETVLVFEFGN